MSYPNLSINPTQGGDYTGNQFGRNTPNSPLNNQRRFSGNNLPNLTDDKLAQQRDQNKNQERQQRLINNFNNLTGLNPNQAQNNSRINSGTGTSGQYQLNPQFLGSGGQTYNVSLQTNPLQSNPNNPNNPGVRVNSRQREATQPSTQFDYEDQVKPINFHTRDQESLFQEINGFKKLLKYIMESQTEMQKKIIDYNKFIAEQENITRLNNLKINEHDSKLTEILITFNNYLKLNDNSTTIINNLTKNYEMTVKKNELNEVKLNLSEVNKNCDMRFGEFSIKYDHLLNKYNELAKEQEVFQKYTLEKLKLYQNENIENKIQQQQTLIKLEDARDQKFNHQFDQIKLMISTSEKNLATEAMIRKSANDSLRDELTTYLRNFDEKLNLLEKSSLETEKKTIDFSKDYITGMKDLMTQNNQKTDIELQALKSLIDTNISKLEIRMEEERKKNQNIIVDMKNIGLEKENNVAQLESWMKENFENMDNKVQANSHELKILEEKSEKITSTLKSILEEKSADGSTGKQVSSQAPSKELKDLKNEFNDLKNEVRVLTENQDKKIEDQKERFELFRKEFNTLQKGFSEKVKLDLTEQNEKIEEFKSSLMEKLKIVKIENEDFRKKFTTTFDDQIDSTTRKLSEEHHELITALSRTLDEKINILHKDFSAEKKEADIIFGGQLQTYVLEAENRIRKSLEERINKMQENVENINIKMSLIEAGEFKK